MNINTYRDLIADKAVRFSPSGMKTVPRLHGAMFPHQRSSTEFALRAGCSGLFLATGLGKSLCSLEWGRVVVEHTNKSCLMLAPLAVSKQHEREAAKFGIDAKAIRDPSEIKGKRIYITNYERLDKFADLVKAGKFGSVVLDESSILKSYGGKTSRALIELFAGMQWKLSATATPAPNDHMELGQQAEFLGCMRSMEMLSRWFINDTATASQVWRLKGHAVDGFWDWVASWARCVTRPSDLGFDDDAFRLPELVTTTHLVEADRSINTGAEKDGQARLFRLPETSATSMHAEKRLTADARAQCIADLVQKEPDEPWIIWVDTGYEAEPVMEAISGAVEVAGNMPADEKEEKLVAFSVGEISRLVTKASIAGYGLNWQHCSRMAFAGLSFSFESYHQAVRRCWRFGQERPVHVHIAMADTEKAIIDVVTRKQDDFETMGQAMRAAMLRAAGKSAVARERYEPKQKVKIPSFMGATT